MWKYWMVLTVMVIVAGGGKASDSLNVRFVAAATPFTPAWETIVETTADGLQKAMTVTHETGLIFTPDTTEFLRPEAPLSTRFQGEVLWVDRAHEHAVASEVAITGNGLGIVASWWLNNDRISSYATLGAGVPLWSHPMPGNELFMDVSAAAGSYVFSGTSDEIATFVWLSPCSNPTLTLPGALKQDITGDGRYLVYMEPGTGMLVCFDTETSTTVWSVPFATGVGLPNGVDISGDGTRVLVSVRDAVAGVQVYSMSDGSPVGSPVGNVTQTKAVISDDGTRFVTGAFDGRVRLWEYDGTDWNLAGNFHTGHSWVTAVGISGDGLTVICGTLGFRPHRGKVLAIDWPATGSPSVMWEDDNYGDMVSSVDINSDGSVLVAGSWGQDGGTFGDVVTVFDRTGDVILSILDDIDEPGSIFSVSIDSGGHFVTASGKAIHARQFGHGGQVYGIQVAPEFGISDDDNPPVPEMFHLGAPTPNPTLGLLSVVLRVPAPGGLLNLSVFDISGRRIAVLVDGPMTPGEHAVTWCTRGKSGTQVPAGIYFLRLDAPGATISRKVTVLR